MRLEKIEHQLEEIERKIKEAKYEDLGKLEKNLHKKYRYLKRRKHQCFNIYADEKIARLINKIRKIEKMLLIIKKERKLYEQIPESVSIAEDKENVVKAKEIAEDKRKEFLENEIETASQKIEILLEQNRLLQIIKKENLEKLKDFSAVRKNEQELKDNIKKINELKEIIQKCKSLEIDLKKVKVNYHHQTHERIKKKCENVYYYKILETLLDNEENYYFIKSLIRENKNFLNAKKEGKPIVQEIVDGYIKNIKKALLNQKIAFVNPEFFLGLLQTFLAQNVELSLEERNEIKIRLEELKTYLEQKEYKSKDKVLDGLHKLGKTEKKIENPEEVVVDKYLVKVFQKDALRTRTRVNLTKEYLEQLNSYIKEIEESYFERNHTLPDETYLKEVCHCSTYDLLNSKVILNTIFLEDQKYAYSYGYDKEFNTYFRIHVFDSSFLNEENALYKEMTMHLEDGSKKSKKLLKFRKEEMAPAFTYQIKILKNGEATSFKMYESIVKVDRVVKNKEWLSFREDSDLKQFVSCLKRLIHEYNLDISFIEHTRIKEIIDTILNIELQKVVTEKNLPTLYSVEKIRTDEALIQEYSKVCAYLSKIPKEEVNAFYTSFVESKVYSFYSTKPMYESRVSLDTSQLVGYFFLLVLKEYSKGIPREQIRMKYHDIFKRLEMKLNQEDTYMRYQTKLYLEKENSCKKLQKK